MEFLLHNVSLSKRIFKDKVGIQFLFVDKGGSTKKLNKFIYGF